MATVYLTDGSNFQIPNGGELTAYAPDEQLTAVCNGSGGVLAVFVTANLRYAVFG